MSFAEQVAKGSRWNFNFVLCFIENEIHRNDIIGLHDKNNKVNNFQSSANKTAFFVC